MLAFLIIGTCAFFVLQLAIAAAAVARFLPTLFNLLRYLTRLMLVCSFRLYRLVLRWLVPPLAHYFKVDLLNGWARLVAAVAISMSLGMTIVSLAHWNLTTWSLGPFALHGLIVGLLWDDLSQPGELQMGIKLS